MVEAKSEGVSHPTMNWVGYSWRRNYYHNWVELQECSNRASAPVKDGWWCATLLRTLVPEWSVPCVPLLLPTEDASSDPDANPRAYYVSFVIIRS